MVTRKVSGEKAFRLPLLFHAAIDHGVYKDKYSREYDEPEKTQLALRVMKTLLAHGAVPSMEFEDTREKPARFVIVLHELIMQHEIVHPILLLPGLDFNRRNGGLTVLHATCQNCNGANAPIDEFTSAECEVSTLSSFLQLTLDSGADALALDNHKHNVFCHLTLSSMRLDEYSPTPLASNGPSITSLASQYPILLDQHDNDGKMPLHLAMEFAVRTHDFTPAQALIDAGADITLLDNENNSVLHHLSRVLTPSVQSRDIFTRLALIHRH